VVVFYFCINKKLFNMKKRVECGANTSACGFSCYFRTTLLMPYRGQTPAFMMAFQSLWLDLYSWVARVTKIYRVLHWWLFFSFLLTSLLLGFRANLAYLQSNHSIYFSFEFYLFF